jgi:hypothetical protein
MGKDMKFKSVIALALGIAIPLTVSAETSTTVEKSEQSREVDSGIPGAPIKEEQRDLEVKKETSDIQNPRAQMNWDGETAPDSERKETLERKEVKRDGFGYPEEKTETKVEKSTSDSAD